MKKLIFSTLTAVAFTAFPTAAQACRSCMGGEAMALTPAIDNSILLLLSVLGVVVAAFLKFVFFLIKCDKQQLQPDSAQSGQE